MKTRIFIFLALASVLLPACQLRPLTTKEVPCSEQAAVFLANIETILQEWNYRPAFLSEIDGHAQTCSDTRSAQGISSCIALIDIVSDIQRLRQEIAVLPAPACAANVQLYLTQYMDAVLEAYQAYMAQEPDSVIEQKLETVADSRDQFYTELVKIKASPNP